MDLITMTRDLAKEIQKDERYIALRLATQSNDEDEKLQDMIGQFNLKRVALSQEMQNPEKDQQKIDQMNTEVKDLYQNIMSYPKMMVYNGAKTEVDKMMNYINRILVLAVNGEDPDAVEEVDVSCSGNCGGCSGCM